MMVEINWEVRKPLVMASLIRDGAISRPLETMSMSYGKARSRLEMKILYLEKLRIKGSTFGSPINISNNPSSSLDPIITNNWRYNLHSMD